jgi:hypothetical protein
MNYQSIRAKIEGPLLTAFNDQIPSIPVYFDNITAVPPDPPNEYVRINLTFGLMTESALDRSFDHARGALIIRCFSPKSAGPARCQEMIQIATNVLEAINSSPRELDSTFVRTSQIKGPDFSSSDNMPHFLGRIDTGWKAMVA